MASRPQSVTVTAMLIALAGFMLGALLVVILGMPRESADGPGVGTGQSQPVISNDAGQFQRPAQGNLQGAGSPQGGSTVPQGTSDGLQGGAPLSEQQARQLLQ